MTPKEKAKELVDKMMNEQFNTEEISQAKQCALICVNEILHELEEEEDGYRMDRVEYWEQVKQEIEKL